VSKIPINEHTGINYRYADFKRINKKVLQIVTINNLFYKEEQRLINMKGSEENLSS